MRCYNASALAVPGSVGAIGASCTGGDKCTYGLCTSSVCVAPTLACPTNTPGRRFLHLTFNVIN